MRCFVTGLIAMMTIIYVHAADYNNILDDILVHPIPAPMNVKKREHTSQRTENLKQFIEEKLIEHSQALEHIVKIISYNEDMMKKLLENLSNNVGKPELPEKIELSSIKSENGRRSYEAAENPVLRMGNNIRRFGKLATDIFLKEIKGDADPTPLVDVKPDLPIKSFRRSFDENPRENPIEQNIKQPSSWCEIAVLCKKNGEPVCGFDDNYGYGKFHDVCHMINVNCYYRYNFLLLHTCRPTL